MLITKPEINTLAFVTALADTAVFQDSIINMIEAFELKEILGATLHDAVITTPTSYTTLIDSYINPFTAFRVKTFYLQQIFTETSPADSEALESIQKQIENAAQLSRSFAQSLREYCALLYPKSTEVISGFVIDVPESTAAETAATVAISISDYEKAKGVRLAMDAEGWYTETYDSSTNTWNATEFKEPI